MSTKWLLLASTIALPIFVRAQDGGVVVSEPARIFKNPDGKEVEFTLHRYDYVVGYTTNLLMMDYSFTRSGDYLKIEYSKQNGRHSTGWILSSDIKPFNWEPPCSSPFPKMITHYLPYSSSFDGWNDCFLRSAVPVADALRNADFKPPQIENSANYSAKFDSVWSGLIETLSDQKWQIESIDKSSGLITTKPANDSSSESMACATQLDSDHKVWLNIFVRDNGDGTVRVKINATFHALRGSVVISCFSNGTIEKSIFESIRKLLPGNGQS